MPGEVEASVDQLAAALAACDSTPALCTRLEEILRRLHALPAILYLRSGEMLRPFAAFDCSREVPAVPVNSLPSNQRSGELPANQVPLTLKGEVVGLLAVFGRVSADPAAFLRCCTILAAKLKHLAQEEALRRELHLANEQVAQLATAGQLLRHLEIEVLMAKTLESALGAVRAQAGCVLVREDDGSERMATWGLRDKVIGALRFKDGGRLVDRLIELGVPSHLDREQLRAALAPEPPLLLGALLALPLAARGRPRGLLLLGSTSDFSPVQRRMAEALSGLAAVALENALLVRAMVDSERIAQELSIARGVQEGMYPTRGLAEAGLLVEGSSRPCDETGGDYFTFLQRPPHVIAMIADVSGHGIGAALFATMAHAIAQHQLRGGAPIASACQALNEGLCHAQSGRFMTCAMVAIAEDRSFSYVSAGHCPILWIHRGEPRWLDSVGLPLGIVLDNPLPAATGYVLDPGDVLVLYTDGVTEAVNAAGEPFGDDRLAAAALQGARLELGPSELMMLINAEVDGWCQGRAHEDDLTMVVIRG